MIVCRGCGTENPEGESFCVSCGSFLEFSGEKIEEPKPAPRQRPVVAPPPPAAAAPPRPAEPVAPVTPAAAPTPPAPPEPPKSSKGRITFSSPRPPQPAAPASGAPTPAASPAAGDAAFAPPAPPAAKGPPLAPPPPPVRVPENEDGKAAPPAATAAPAASPAAPAAPVAPAANPANAATPPADAAVSGPAAPADSPADSPADAPADAPSPVEAKNEPDERVKALVTRPIRTEPTVVRAGQPRQPGAPASGGPGVGAMQPRAPEARQPTAQQPGMPTAKPPPVKPPKAKAKQYRPGDLFCGACGEGNPPTRKFCHKCGESLATAAVVADAPWYKRIFKREKKVYKAGERGKNYDGSPSGARRGIRRVKTIFKYALIIGFLLLIVLAVGPWKDQFNAKRESVTRKIKGFFVATYEPIHPDGAQATTSKPENPPGNAIDGTTNLAWLENAPGDGEGQTLIITFKQQVSIDRIGFRIGASDDPEEFLAEPRPRVVHLVFSNGNTQDITLKDKPDFQNFQVKGKASVRVEITIVSTNPSAKGGHDTGFAEVEFFKKS